MARAMRYSRPKTDPPESVVQFLCRRFPYLSEQQWREHMAAGNLLLNSNVCHTADRILAQGDTVLFQPPRSLEPRVDEEHIDVLCEDDAILVCAKNGELPVAEGGRYCENTLLGVLKRRGTHNFLPTRTDATTRKRSRSEDPQPALDTNALLVSSSDDPPPAYFPVHRLDKETSGLLVMGKTLQSAQTLSHQFEQQSTRVLDALAVQFAADKDIPPTDSACRAHFAHIAETHKLVVKTYRAVVVGALPVGTVRVVSQRIGKQCEDPLLAAHPSHQKLKKLKMACFGPSLDAHAAVPGKPAVSRLTWLRADPAARLSLVEVSLLTGRTHQIRLHCAHLGFPIVGDKLYTCRTLGEEGGLLAVEDDVYMEEARRSETERLPSRHHPKLLCKRHLLHATQLSFEHPVTGDVVDVASPAAAWFLRDVQTDDETLRGALAALLDGL